jgi:transcriptional regulator with XRE-family HTH domain
VAPHPPPDPNLDKDGDLLQELLDEATTSNPGFPRLVAAAERQRELVRWLTDRRRSQRLSQSEVARRMGTTQPAIAKIEAFRHEPLLSTLQRYAASVGSVIEFELVDIDLRDGTGPFEAATPMLISDSPAAGAALPVAPVKVEVAARTDSDAVTGIAHVAVSEELHAGAEAMIDYADYIEVQVGTSGVSAVFERLQSPPTFVSRQTAERSTRAREPVVEVYDPNDQKVYLAISQQNESIAPAEAVDVASRR